MIILNTDRETISGACGKDNFSVPYDHDMYEKLVALRDTSEAVETVDAYRAIVEEFMKVISSYDYNEAIASELKDLVFVPASEKYHLRVGNGISDLHIPEQIVESMKANHEAKIENDPLLNLCRRFMLNPKPTQRRFEFLAAYINQDFVDKEAASKMVMEQGVTLEVALKACTYPDLQVTRDGYLKTSKVVDEILTKYSIVLDDNKKPVLDENGKPKTKLVPRYETSYTVDEETGEMTETTEYPEFLEERKFTPAIHTNGDKFLSGDKLGYKYEIGKVAALESWDQVNMQDGQKHCKGLHTGGLRYIDNYLHGNSICMSISNRKIYRFRYRRNGV